ncbi:penicillin acylase family protein [Agaribacter flavus]|uniref:Penicillin acylase family protein n=1 Tax=Agaribacter flavus TaxID=1902781 RepID=A0ABV7FQR6_9ALTE
MTKIKWIAGILLSISILILLGVYFSLAHSLPTLDGVVKSARVSKDSRIDRDTLGTAIIHAKDRVDAAYSLGYAHAQDRLFQMDLLRKNAAGELSSIVGKRALDIDISKRAHQFRRRAQNIVKQLPKDELALLTAYANGVNDAVSIEDAKPFEYILTNTRFSEWLPEDSLLAIFSMYIDLQQDQIERDFHFTGIQHYTGKAILDFFTPASNYQASIDFSLDTRPESDIPHPPTVADEIVSRTENLQELPDIGSNNWVVSGKHVKDSNSALLSNDMHLGLAVPTLWYRAQLNYQQNGKAVSATGVSLPGVPAIVVGATKHIAWGFTNANVDNVDWVKLAPDTPIEQVSERFTLSNGEVKEANILVSEYGPVRYIEQQAYALKWVAHQDYALNLKLAKLAEQRDMTSTLQLAKSIAIPVQNLVVGDSQGNVAWQLTGAISARTSPTKIAIEEYAFDTQGWASPERSPANFISPDHGRIWSANARMVSANDLARYGDGGYALGARQQQIANALMGASDFSEQSFYDLQLDNQAVFLMPWHHLLLSTLKQHPELYKQDIDALTNWKACACSDSVGYTLVRRFRSNLINELLSPVTGVIRELDPSYTIKPRYLLRGIEPAIWQLLQEKPEAWLTQKYDSYDHMYKAIYQQTKKRLLAQYSNGSNDMTSLAWGEVNALQVKHPLASALGVLGNYLNMRKVQAFGDSFMPAVQSPSFGASQRMIVKPGKLEQGILTVPGGQSMHPLSAYYRSGFEDYANHRATPLLPQDIKHSLLLSAK